ncbi:hypothetical protein [Candidatus Ichthyocystis sparus]|nr:hypothetical protein [Candidatus Ichthyocystis sparus]
MSAVVLARKQLFMLDCTTIDSYLLVSLLSLDVDGVLRYKAVYVDNGHKN